MEQLRRLHHLFAPSCTKLIYQRHTVLQRPNFAAKCDSHQAPCPKTWLKHCVFGFIKAVIGYGGWLNRCYAPLMKKEKGRRFHKCWDQALCVFFFSFFVCAFKLITPKCLLCETIYLIVRNGLLCPILHSTAITKRQNYFVVLEKFNPEETFQDMSIFLQALYYLARLRPLGNELYKTE